MSSLKNKVNTDYRCLTLHPLKKSYTTLNYSNYLYLFFYDARVIQHAAQDVYMH